MSWIPVIVYTTPNCVQCMSTKRQFDQLGVVYDEVDLSENPEMLEKFKAEGHLAAPIVTTDIKTWSGFRATKIKSLAMHIQTEGRNGEV